mgnify:FL=1
MNNNTLVYIGRLLVLVSVSFYVATFAHAMPDSLSKDGIVEKVVQAYGGEKLAELNSLSVHDRYKVFSMDQGENPAVNSITRLYSTLTVDFKTGEKSVKSWRVDSNGHRLSEILYDGQTSWRINHLRGTHVEDPVLKPSVVGAGMMKMIDTVMAQRLAAHRDSVELVSHNVFAGKSTYTLSFMAEKSEPYFIDVDAISGFILRMSKSLSRTTGTVYHYGKHKRVEGLAFATDMNMLVKGKPRFITLSRRIEVNTTNQQSFLIPKKSIKLKGFIDSSKMIVNKLADKVYLAGKGSNFSIFVDTGHYFIGAGGLPGITNRLAALNEYLGTNYALKKQVIPDHHRGHLGALKELQQMGTSIIIAPTHREIINSQLVSNEGVEISPVDNKLILADGMVEVYNIHTTHAQQYLLFYVPSAKLVFSADHFGTNLIEALPGANNTVATFYSEIERLGLQVQYYAHAHGPRILSHTDLENVVAGYQITPCPTNENICAD